MLVPLLSSSHCVGALLGECCALWGLSIGVASQSNDDVGGAAKMFLGDGLAADAIVTLCSIQQGKMI